MKKINIILFITLLFMLMFSSVNAVELNTLNITTDKIMVNPNSTVTINFDFGVPLGAYTFDIDFDDALLEYMTTTGDTSTSVTGDIATVFFTDMTGGSNPNSGMSITFRAKSGITTSNPTQFLITATGMVNPDGSVLYDDIGVPIIKDVLVEPEYSNYSINVEYTEPILKNEEKPIKINISSPIGRYYEHLRLVAEVTKPTGAIVKLMGIDSASLEHDVILSGWGNPAGFGLGGAVNESYNFRGIFSEDGEYTVTLNLIDRDDSDKIIANKVVTFKVGQVLTINEKPKEELPKELPQTGTYLNLYSVAGIAGVICLVGYAIYYAKYERKKLNID